MCKAAPGTHAPASVAAKLRLDQKGVWEHFYRYAIDHTPAHGSWLNQAEIEIGIFSRQCLGIGRISDLETLNREARAWNRRINRHGTKIHWNFDRKAPRRKFGYKRKSFTRLYT